MVCRRGVVRVDRELSRKNISDTSSSLFRAWRSRSWLPGQGHHLFVASQSVYAERFFRFIRVAYLRRLRRSILSLSKRSISYDTPMLYASFHRLVYHRRHDRIAPRIAGNDIQRQLNLYCRALSLHHGRRNATVYLGGRHGGPRLAAACIRRVNDFALIIFVDSIDLAPVSLGYMGMLTLSHIWRICLRGKCYTYCRRRALDMVSG
jgi:hypothetical protein